MGQDHLVLNAGSSYGDEGLGFMRLNFAVDLSVLDQAIERLQAFDQRHQARKFACQAERYGKVIHKLTIPRQFVII